MRHCRARATVHDKDGEPLDVDLDDVLAQVTAKDVIKCMGVDDLISDIPVDDFIKHYGKREVFGETFDISFLQEHICAEDIIKEYGMELVLDGIEAQDILDHLLDKYGKGTVIEMLCSILKDKEAI